MREDDVDLGANDTVVIEVRHDLIEEHRLMTYSGDVGIEETVSAKDIACDSAGSGRQCGVLNVLKRTSNGVRAEESESTPRESARDGAAFAASKLAALEAAA